MHENHSEKGISSNGQNGEKIEMVSYKGLCSKSKRCALNRFSVFLKLFKARMMTNSLVQTLAMKIKIASAFNFIDNIIT